MATPPIKYNPAFLSVDELIKGFVVRLTDLELVLEVINENTESTNQHLLIIGPRGAGKTSLVLRTVAEIRREASLVKLWYPIIFAEESYEVCSPGEFWLEAVFHLSRQTKAERWKKVYQELCSEKDEKRLQERALSQLMDFADDQQKRLLLVVENLNMLLGEQMSDDDAWTLRHTFQNEPRLMLLGTATSRFEQHDNAGKAMFEMFKIHELQPLEQQDCQQLWTFITGQNSKGDRIRPIQILTGGNPRLLIIISAFAAKTSFKELMSELTQLVDEHTEYFKSHLDNLPSLERKVFVALADLWNPSTAKEVSEASRVNVNKASAYLQRLVGKGAVVVVDQQGRKKWYQLAERMYNIYHLMRRRGEPSSRVRAVVDFMVHFYTDDDLAQTTARIAYEAINLPTGLRSDHFQALEEILKSPKTIQCRAKIISQLPEDILASANLPDSLRKLVDTNGFNQEASPLPFSETEIKQGSPQDTDDPNSWWQIGTILMKDNSRLDDAEQAFKKAIEIEENFFLAWYWLGEFYKDQDRFQEAKSAFKKAVTIEPENYWAWTSLGLTFFLNDDSVDESEEAFKNAIRIDNSNVLAWGGLGFLLHHQSDRHEDAEEAYRKVISINPDDWFIWKNIGDLLHKKRNCPDEAEEAYRKSIVSRPTVEAWFNLGLLLQEQNRYHDAKKAFENTLNLNQENQYIWLYIIEFQMEVMGDSKKALHISDDFFNKAGRTATNLNSLARLFVENGWHSHMAHAEGWSNEAVLMEPDNPSYNFTLAAVLGELRKWEKSLSLFDKFLGDKEFCDDAISKISNLIINAAVSGYTEQSLNVLQKYQSSPGLEPLIVGLQLFIGEKVRTAQEILEVGKDVAERITQRINTDEIR